MSSKTSDESKQVQDQARDRIEQIRLEIARFDFVCSGTLMTRKKVCGKAGCRCAEDPEARHGPYLEWGRRHSGKLLHRNLTRSDFEVVGRAINNRRRVLDLLAEWEQLSISILVGKGPKKRGRSRGPDAER